MLIYEIVHLLLTVLREDGAPRFFSGVEPLRPIWRWVGIYERDCGEAYPEVSSFSAQFSAIPGLGYPFVRAGGDILKSWHLLYPRYCNRHKV